MTTIHFFAEGLPIAQPRQRFCSRKTKAGKQFIHNYVPAKHPVNIWRETFAWQAKQYRPQTPLSGPIALMLQFVFPRLKKHLSANGKPKATAPFYKDTKPDWDNLGKAVSDVLTTLQFWRDDAQISIALVTKTYDERAGVQVIIEELKQSKPERD
jgi:Holliday junction resolvase RusA-like endonuclease